MSNFENCTIDNYSDICESMRTTASTILAIIGFISGIGSLAVIFSIIYFKLYRKMKYRLVLYVCISDFFQAMAPILGVAWIANRPVIGQFVCVLQGYFYHFSNVSSALLNLLLNLYVTLYVLSVSDLKGPWYLPGRKFEIICQLSWVIGIGLAMYGLFGSTDENFSIYGPVTAGTGCWIRAVYSVRRVSLHYIYNYVCVIGMVILTTINIVYLDRQKDIAPSMKKKMRGLVTRLIGYPIIYIISFIPLALDRTLSIFSVELPLSYTLISLYVLSTNGFLTAIYYGWTRNILQMWRSTTTDTEFPTRNYQKFKC